MGELRPRPRGTGGTWASTDGVAQVTERWRAWRTWTTTWCWSGTPRAAWWPGPQPATSTPGWQRWRTSTRRSSAGASAASTSAADPPQALPPADTWLEPRPLGVDEHHGPRTGVLGQRPPRPDAGGAVARPRRQPRARCSHPRGLLRPHARRVPLDGHPGGDGPPGPPLPAVRRTPRRAARPTRAQWPTGCWRSQPVDDLLGDLRHRLVIAHPQRHPVSRPTSTTNGPRSEHHPGRLPATSWSARFTSDALQWL